MARLRFDALAELTWEQDLELICGPFIGPNWPDDQDDSEVFIAERSNFASEEERREAWLIHRERIVDWSPEWTRPWAWWRYELGIAEPGDNSERQRLLEEHGD